MLSTFDWKLVDCVMMDHLWDAVEWLTELTEDVVAASASTSIITANDLHVHETTRTPGNIKNKIIKKHVFLQPF